MWINDNIAPGALLAGVGPRVSGHPGPVALGTAILAEAPGCALIRSLVAGGVHFCREKRTDRSARGWMVISTWRLSNTE